MTYNENDESKRQYEQYGDGEDIMTGLEIAVIGMDGRFPGAPDIQTFWDNLINGRETITFFSDEELEKAGISETTLANPNYVKAQSRLEDAENFDPAFFDYTPKESEILDPQVRVFHECAWKALEDAGYNPHIYEGPIGCFAGASGNFYWEALSLLSSQTADGAPAAAQQLFDKDYLTTRVAHKLNLKGPAVSVHTACSTSLVSVHLACQSLLGGECDMALAGGVSIINFRKKGYHYRPGMVLSSDGHCRSFAEGADGSIFGDGVGVVVLKRYEEAVEDGDHIYAVIKGSFINNDGINRGGYTAPTAEGQAAVIRTALQAAEVDPGTIGYIETHGTATSLGDPIEIDGLKLAFNTDKKQFCHLGAVKTNVGHLNIAAGITGFIKTVLTLKHQQIPPTLHFETPNPQIDFENSPFIINTGLIPWESSSHQPRRAGVSAFGLGGTNAHVVLEEYVSKPKEDQQSAESEEDKKSHIFMLSARTPEALERNTQNLGQFLVDNSGLNPADVAFTLQNGRKHLAHRRLVVCTDTSEAGRQLIDPDPTVMRTFHMKVKPQSVAFMFSGLGSQYIHMGRGLYDSQPMFRKEADRCFNILETLTGQYFKNILYPVDSTNVFPDALDDIETGQAVMFTIEYALARLLLSWGITPNALVGYSFGEYVAACIAGVFTLENALKLVVTRGRLVKKTPPGSMLSVPLPMERIMPLLSLAQNLYLAIDNGESCIVAGKDIDIENFQKQLKEQKIITVPVNNSRALHSPLMNSIMDEFEDCLRTMTLNKPSIPLISNVTGNWADEEEITTPQYWMDHLSHTVEFAAGMMELARKEDTVFIEIGPGQDVSALILRYIDKNAGQKVTHMLRLPTKNVTDPEFLLNQLGRLWLWGVEIDWSQFYPNQKRQRLPLPTYSFDALLFPFNEDQFINSIGMLAGNRDRDRRPPMNEWFYVPSWERVPLSPRKPVPERSRSRWVIFTDNSGIADSLIPSISENADYLIIVKKGDWYAKHDDTHYTIRPEEENDFRSLFNEPWAKEKMPDHILHLWGISDNEFTQLDNRRLEEAQEFGYFSLINIAKSLGIHLIDHHIQITVITNNMQEVIGNDLLYPEKSTVMGPIRVIPFEYKNLNCRSIDISYLPASHFSQYKFADVITQQLLEEIHGDSPHPYIAFRGPHRWIQNYIPHPLGEAEPGEEQYPRLKNQGVYLITGGMGGIGMALATYLAQTVQARLILLGRKKFPPRSTWEKILETFPEDDPVILKIRQLQKIEKDGGQFLLVSADIASPHELEAALNPAIKEMGTIDGVIHAAGLADGEIIQKRSPVTCQKILAPKVNGTFYLDRLLKDNKPDFFIYSSSTAGLLGGVGQVGYCAANTFLDAFAQYQNTHYGVFASSINWGRWQSTGIARIAEKHHKELNNEELLGGMTHKEGVETFRRVLAENFPNMAVTRRDIPEMFQRFNPQILSLRQQDDKTTGEKPAYQRPDHLTTQYVEPTTSTQKQMAEIIQDVLGYQKVGILDDFLQLGADSLRFINVASKIENNWKVKVHVTDLFAKSTVKEVAEFIDDILIRTKKVEESKADALSDENNSDNSTVAETVNTLKAFTKDLACIELLNNGTAEKNIFMVHPMHGMVYQYKKLAQLLESNYNVFGIQVAGLVPGSKLPETPSQMINQYLEQILAVQGQGPFIITGYCAGVYIAYEIVRRLEELGHNVESLVLFNNPVLFSEKYIETVHKFATLPESERIAIMEKQRKEFEEAASVAIAKTNEPDKIITCAAVPNESLSEQIKAAVSKRMKLLSDHIYSPGFIKAPILAVLARRAPISHDSMKDFDKITESGSSFVVVPGTHNTLFDSPNVEEMAPILRDALLITWGVHGNHLKLSNTSADFLKYVQKNPEGFQRKTFNKLSELETYYDLLSWPIYIRTSVRKEMESASVEICRLIKSIPKRIFNNDVQRISEYYEYAPLVVEKQLRGASQEQLDSLLSRGDFLQDVDGFKCLEFNISANIGGFRIPIWEEFYQVVPFVDRFHKENNIKLITENQYDVFLENLVDSALNNLIPDDESVSIVIVIPLYTENHQSDVIDLMRTRYRIVLERKGLPTDGQLYFATYRNLKVRGEKIYLDEIPIKVLIETYAGIVPPHVQEIIDKKRVIVLNGPVTGLLGNKLNLALLSENCDSTLFTSEEQEYIKKYIPWTRKVVAGGVTWQGKTFDMKTFLVKNRERMVLKCTVGYGGKEVFVGKYTEENQWKRQVESAMETRTWLVQEYIPGVPLVSQIGDSGCSVHDAVWGFFVFGNRYGGSMIRLAPRKDTSGVVNVAQGARLGIAFEIDE